MTTKEMPMVKKVYDKVDKTINLIKREVGIIGYLSKNPSSAAYMADQKDGIGNLAVFPETMDERIKAVAGAHAYDLWKNLPKNQRENGIELYLSDFLADSKLIASNLKYGPQYKQVLLSTTEKYSPRDESKDNKLQILTADHISAAADTVTHRKQDFSEFETKVEEKVESKPGALPKGS